MVQVSMPEAPPASRPVVAARNLRKHRTGTSAALLSSHRRHVASGTPYAWPIWPCRCQVPGDSRQPVAKMGACHDDMRPG